MESSVVDKCGVTTASVATGRASGVSCLRRSFAVLFVLSFSLIPVPFAQNSPAYKQTIEAIQEEIESNRLDEALNLIQTATSKYPHDGGLENLLGIVEIQQGHKQEAIKAFSAAILHNPRLVSAYLNLSRIEMDAAAADPKARAQALRLIRKALELEPLNNEANYEAATIFFWDKDYQESLRHLDKLTSESRSQVGAQALFCADHATLGNNEDTTSAANALAANPDLTEQDVDTCLPALRTARRADLIEKLLASAQSHQALTPSGLRFMGLAQEAQGEFNLARKTLESAFEGDPQSATILEDLARVAKSQNDDTGALGYLAHARDLKPGDPTYAYEFALVCMRLNLFGEARKALTEALRLAPDNPDYNLKMGQVVSYSSDPPQSLKYLERYHQLRPGDPEGILALGTANYRAKDFDTALKWLQQAVAYPKTAADAHFFIGRIARQEGDTAKAVGELTQSLALNPEQPEALAELGQINTSKRNFSDAATQIEQALKLDPESYAANFGLLQLYVRTNDPRRDQQSRRFEEIKNKREERDRQMMRTIEIRPDGNPDGQDVRPSDTRPSDKSEQNGDPR